MIYATKRCMHCGKPGIIGVNENELFAYLRGELAQDAFKTLPAPLREQVISGTHPECWDAIFGEPDPDEGYDRMREEQWQK